MNGKHLRDVGFSEGVNHQTAPKRVAERVVIIATVTAA